MVIQIAEVLETTVSVLLGEEIPSSEEPDFIKTLAAKLEVLNEQYSKQNEHRRKIWRIVFAVIWLFQRLHWLGMCFSSVQYIK